MLEPDAWIGWTLLAGVFLMAGTALAQWIVNSELRRQLKEMRRQHDIVRQEVQVLTDAIARANRTPVLREAATKLAPSETWYEGRGDVSKVTAS